MNEFWQCFVPLFVAVDALGCLPAFLALTQDLKPDRRRAVIAQSIITAAVVICAFLAAGPKLLIFLGINVWDFMIAGGILLLVISLSDILSDEQTKDRSIDAESLGAVPIGVPMITGPAVLTTCVLLASTHGKGITALAATLNIAIAGIVFLFAQPLGRILGRTGTKTLSKVANLLLAAIAVMLIRRGICDTIASLHAPK